MIDQNKILHTPSMIAFGSMFKSSKRELLDIHSLSCLSKLHVTVPAENKCSTD